MASSNNRMRIYIRGNQLTDEVQARIFETGGNFTQHDTIGEGDNVVAVWELAHYEIKAWEDVAKWMAEVGVDFNTESLPLVGKREKPR